MKRHAIGTAVCLALLGQQGTALAQPIEDVASANSVMPGCREFINPKSGPDYRQGICGGIVRAMFFFGKTRLEVCTPHGANLGQAVRVVVAYIDQRPARMHERFEALAVEALQQAWPCKR